jgi:hypothetical protein
LARREILVLGARLALGTAVVAASRARGFDVIDTAAERVSPPTSDGDSNLYAVVVIPPVLVFDHGDTRPRRFRVDLDAFGHDDPRDQGRWAATGLLGTGQIRRQIEAVAGPGTRLAMLSASLFLDPHPPRSRPSSFLAREFEADELPLLLHRRLTILEGPLPRSLPQLWSIEALPSGMREGWGLGALTAFHRPPPPASRRDQLDEEARSLLDSLVQLRRTTAGLQLGEAPF